MINNQQKSLNYNSDSENESESGEDEDWQKTLLNLAFEGCRDEIDGAEEQFESQQQLLNNENENEISMESFNGKFVLKGRAMFI
jgi:hypothetical protein